MSALCLLDTSILLEFLAVPSKSGQLEKIKAEMAQKITAGESLFLPMASVFETGNHIGQNGDGTLRRECAARFVQLVQQAMQGKTPFTTIAFPNNEQLQSWLNEFPDHAKTGSGLGDLSIIHDWRRLCELHPVRRVYIWSLDGHLSAYDWAGVKQADRK
jgi:hypothetical protein